MRKMNENLSFQILNILFLLCMCGNVSPFIHVCVYMCLYEFMCVSESMCLYVTVFMCNYVCLYMCMCLFLYIWVCIHVSLYKDIDVHVCKVFWMFVRMCEKFVHVCMCLCLCEYLCLNNGKCLWGNLCMCSCSVFV